jgi:hypothetical protein
VLVRQGCERKGLGALEGDPDRFCQLGAGAEFTIPGANVEEVGFEQVVGLVRRLAEIGRHEARIVFVRSESEFLGELSGKGFEGRFVRVDLAAGLHEGARAALAHQQQSTGPIVDESRGDTDPLRHAREDGPPPVSPQWPEAGIG